MTDPDEISQDALDADWRAHSEAVEILDEPQFARRDVLELTGLSDAQLKNTLDRDLVSLANRHNPGTGRRRMFTGGDVLKLTVAHTMSAIGFPMRWSHIIADQVERRAINRVIGLASGTDLMIATYPNAAGDDWAFVTLSSENQDPPGLPLAVQLLAVDKLIDNTLAKLRALVADEPIPDLAFKFPELEPSPYSPENDFFRMWATDGEGRTIRTGLTFEETQELGSLEEANMKPGAGRDREAGRRYLDLHDKHELARLKRIAAENEERLSSLAAKNNPQPGGAK